MQPTLRWDGKDVCEVVDVWSVAEGMVHRRKSVRIWGSLTPCNALRGRE